jgi:LacI family transcriptional regulator
MPRNRKPRLPKVLLLVETSTGYGRGILDGIGRYIREHGPWWIYFERRGHADPLPRWIRRWQGHGIISRTATPALARTLHAIGLPVVELLGTGKIEPAMVRADNVAVGRLAAEHLLDCGLRHFGFFASGETWWIAQFREGFIGVLAGKGYGCSVYRPPGRPHLSSEWQDTQEPAVVAWLRALPRPVGVFTSGPEQALCLLDLCHEHGVAVPEEVAILAAGDDPAIYTVTTPSLSGLDTNPSLVGYEAAAMLDRMMAGQSPPKDVLLVPPTGVVARQSTDTLAIADPEVALAVRFIRERACERIKVPQVAAAANLSRRVLERRFQEHLGRTPKEEILRVRIERAKILLDSSDLAIELIAKRSGFASFKNFATVFRREVGTTPRQFRRERKTGHSATRDLKE